VCVLFDGFCSHAECLVLQYSYFFLSIIAVEHYSLQNSETSPVAVAYYCDHIHDHSSLPLGLSVLCTVLHLQNLIHLVCAFKFVALFVQCFSQWNASIIVNLLIALMMFLCSFSDLSVFYCHHTIILLLRIVAKCLITVLLLLNVDLGRCDFL